MSTTRRLLPGLSVRDGYTVHPFDAEYGLRTSGLVAGRHLKSGHAHDRQITAYYGIAPSVLRRIVKRWQTLRPAAPLAGYTFIDVGAGMGRAMLIAAEMSFCRVIGVELHPVLARIAQKNILRWCAAGRARAPMQMECGDAMELALPQTPTVLFLFNPFGATVMRLLLKRIASSYAERPGQLDLLYVNDEQKAVIDAQRGFKLLWRGQIERSKTDAIADHRILANQPEGEYSSSNYEDCSIYRWVGRG